MANIDNSTPVSQMTDEQLEQAIAGTEQVDEELDELDLVEDQEVEPDEDAPDEWTPPETLRIGEEELPYEEVVRLASQGKDYTRKTQALAEERKEVEAWMALRDRWNSGPDQQAELVRQLAALAGVQAPATTQTPEPNPEYDAYGNEIDWEEMGEVERHLFVKQQKLQKAYDAKFAQLEPLLKELHGVIGRQVQSEQRDLKASEAATALRSELGVEVTPEAVRAAIESTGLEDGYAAWLRANAKDLVKAASAKGAEAVKAQKPNSPGQSGGRVFDPDKKDSNGNYVYSPSRVSELIEKGYQPISK